MKDYHDLVIDGRRSLELRLLLFSPLDFSLSVFYNSATFFAFKLLLRDSCIKLSLEWMLLHSPRRKSFAGLSGSASVCVSLSILMFSFPTTPIPNPGF